MDATAGSSGESTSVTGATAGGVTVVSTGATAGSTSVVTGSAAASTGSVAFTWNDGWRERMANGDEKELKRLQRFTSPEDIFKMARSLETRMSSGELKSQLRKDATADEVKAWRLENGIPPTSEGYELKLLDGRDVAEADKPVLKGLLDLAHKHNFTSEQLKAAVSWQYQNAAGQEVAQTEADTALHQQVTDALNKEWGADYRANMNMIATNVERGGSELSDLLMQGRLSDGTPIRSSPAILKWIVANEREVNPAGTVIPGAGGNIASSIDDEIADLEKKMQDRNAWFKDEPAQARYRQLLEAKDKLKDRK